MKPSKQNQLFEAMRREPALQPPSNFAAAVLSVLRHDSTIQRFNDSTLNVLAAFFPRFAAAALLIMTLCAATEAYLKWHEAPVDMAQIAQEWFFAAE